ncbi:MAG: ribonuclease H-like domain-containing protein [Candidatus Saccharicenans sp.]
MGKGSRAAGKEAEKRGRLMDIDELRETLRRKARNQSNQQDKVKEIWKNLDSRKDLTTKEKLEKLLALSRKAPLESRNQSRMEVSELASARKDQPYLVLENKFNLSSRYGQIPISLGLNIPGKVLALLSRDEAFELLSLSQALFIDLETTGLAGGTGTVPFLVGLGYFENEAFKIIQFFLNDLAAEARMLQEIKTLCEDKKFSSIVSYNGKGFDLPLLETRFALNRLPFPLEGLPHLDFLFSARYLWKHKYESCRLYNLALEHLGADRAEDIPSEEIPWRYFQYLRNQDFSLVEPILYHNQEDIMSLYGVVVAGAVLVAKSVEEDQLEADALDLFGVGKIWERAGEVERSVVLYERALDKKLPGEVSVKVKKNLAHHFKKSRRWEKALRLWQELVEGSEDLECFRELAMYFEHQAKNPEEALKYALDGLALARGVSPGYEEDFQRRIDRLKRKAENLKSFKEGGQKEKK